MAAMKTAPTPRSSSSQPEWPGSPARPGWTWPKTNISITRDIAHRIMQYATNPILVVVSNPVDVLTYVVQQETGLPATGSLVPAPLWIPPDSAR